MPLFSFNLPGEMISFFWFNLAPELNLYLHPGFTVLDYNIDFIQKCTLDLLYEHAD